METNPLYSIWLPGVGWLRISDDYYVCTERAIAVEIAHNIGGARVYYADTNNAVMQGLETLYLAREQRSLWMRIKSWIGTIKSQSLKIVTKP